MMMKLSIPEVITLSLVLLLASTTAACRSTITTVQVEVDNRGLGTSEQPCDQQIRLENLQHCQQYVRQLGGRGSYLEMIADKSSDRRQQQEHERRCCEELKQFNEWCQCPALGAILVDQITKGQLGGQQIVRVIQQIPDLPQRCHVGSQRCLFRVMPGMH